MAMSYNHLGMYVSDLGAAERFCEKAFGLEVAFREVVAADGEWHTLPPDKGWGDAARAGVEISMVALRGDDMVLPLFLGDRESAAIVEIGLRVSSQAAVDEIAARLPDEGTCFTHEHADLLFSESFGFRWHVVVDGQPFLSNGEHSERWVDLQLEVPG